MGTLFETAQEKKANFAFAGVFAGILRNAAVKLSLSTSITGTLGYGQGATAISAE
jgi:hypothetical protein